jgi:hypothetical protein
MKGQVFTVAKLHYINGVVYEVAKRDTTDIQTLADLSQHTTKRGKAKHPMVRVRTLARLAEGVGLVEIFNKHKMKITNLGRQYAEKRSTNQWEISKEQQKILGHYIIADSYRSETIYSIATLFELCKKGYAGDELSHKFAEEIGKLDAWKSEATFRGFTKFGLSYISELGLLEIDEKDLLIEDISKDQRYQNDINSVEPISLPAGEIPRSKPKKYGGTEKYSTNPRRARCSLEKAHFQCELNPSHKTFVNKKSGKQYMEAHHLVPMGKQGLFEFDIDVPENILCICPNCHRKMHLAEDEDREKTLAQAFKLRETVLPARGIKIDMKTLLEIYSID